MSPFKLLILENTPIYAQLQLEEALLRTSQENWCILNTGSPPAIVMGISGKPEQLINLEFAESHQIPLIKRFSGGGTVYIEPHTVFSTLICNQTTFDLPLQPQPLLQWSATFYQTVVPTLRLRENDYVLEDKKCGGNAQYIQKERWLLHTSFLWDYTPDAMQVLLLPQKRPAYRNSRSHTDFLCTLRPHFPEKKALLSALKRLAITQLGAQETHLEEASLSLRKPHRTTTVELKELKMDRFFGGYA